MKVNRAPPVYVQTADGQQIFGNHIDAVTLSRAQMAKFFNQGIEDEDTQQAAQEVMFNRMNHMGNAWLELTGSFIAKRLPFYTVTFV